MGEHPTTNSTLAPPTLDIVERTRSRFHVKHLAHDLGEFLWRNHGSQLSVEFPSPKTDGQWELLSTGWVGSIPLPSGLVLHIHPKVAVGNLFRMLEYAYQLKSFTFLKSLVHVQTLPEVYESLAIILAHKVLERSRKGFHRDFVSQQSPGSSVRGRIDLKDLARRPWAVPPRCHIQTNTVDTIDNQILAWTLQTIAQSGLCRSRGAGLVGRAWRTLWGSVTLSPFGPEDCVARTYNRMNQDYRPLHALCRFFLAHCGPRHERGERPMLPFLVNMDRLYEHFVAEWIGYHLPNSLDIRAQQRVNIDRRSNVYFNIDLVLYALQTGKVLAVLDTKYKNSAKPASNDLAQIVAYAQSLGCTNAFLIYPTAFEHPFDVQIGDVRIRRLTFALDNDLEENGQQLLDTLLKMLGV